MSMGQCKKNITTLLTHWSYIFLVLSHRYGPDTGCVLWVLWMKWLWNIELTVVTNEQSQMGKQVKQYTHQLDKPDRRILYKQYRGEPLLTPAEVCIGTSYETRLNGFSMNCSKLKCTCNLESHLKLFYDDSLTSKKYVCQLHMTI